MGMPASKPTWNSKERPCTGSSLYYAASLRRLGARILKPKSYTVNSNVAKFSRAFQKEGPPFRWSGIRGPKQTAEEMPRVSTFLFPTLWRHSALGLSSSSAASTLNPKPSYPLPHHHGSFRKLGVPYLGVLIIRILLFRVLY